MREDQPSHVEWSNKGSRDAMETCKHNSKASWNFGKEILSNGGLNLRTWRREQRLEKGIKRQYWKDTENSNDESWERERILIHQILTREEIGRNEGMIVH